MSKFNKLSRAEMKNVLGGIPDKHPCSFYYCNIDGTHGVCPATCACGPLTIENGTEFIPCVDPVS